MPTKKASNSQKEGKRDSEKPPVLLIGWGPDGAEDIYRLREQSPHDTGLDCVDAETVSAKRVLEEIEDWLKYNPNAQLLYVGSHGNKSGLDPKRKVNKLNRIEWHALARVLSTKTEVCTNAEKLASANTNITLCIGACSSAFAAESWKKNPPRRVRMIVGFSTRPGSEEVRRVIDNVVRKNSLGEAEPGQVMTNPEYMKDISYDKEDIRELLEQFPQITIRRRVKRGYVDCREEKNEVEEFPHGEDINSAFTQPESDEHQPRWPRKKIAVRKITETRPPKQCCQS